LTPGHLEKFAAQIFKQMGYQVKHTGRTGDHGIDVHMVNPTGQVEIVQCKQLNKPVGEAVVRELLGVIKHEKAVRGFIFAPGGFTQEARRWAKGEPIVLADEKEINRLVESAYGRE
jgi:restriction system protein